MGGTGLWTGAFLFIYRKFLKLSEIVYNKHESKNDMTKERRGRLRHDVVCVVLLVRVVAALSDYREMVIMSKVLSITHDLSISFK